MYKLSGHSLTRNGFFLPESMQLTLTERDSSCQITLGPEAPEIGLGDWLLDDEAPGGPIVWRVKSVEDTPDTDSRSIELEHAIKTLDDVSVTSEVTTETIAGSGATSCTARQAVSYLLGLQGDWQLGNFAYSDSNPYAFDGETLLDGIGNVTDTLQDSVWEYDMSRYPFLLHIRQLDSTVKCEMRGGRNLSTLRRTISRTGMYTRIYPTGYNNLEIGYLSKNEGKYGRIDHPETDQSKKTAAELQVWAQARLNRHCEPLVSVSISGLELSESTGESLDRLGLNTVCRAPLPEYGTTITERIVKLQWRDRVQDPQNVTVTLANEQADAASLFRENKRSGGRAAKGQAKQNYLFQANGEHLYYEVFDESGHLHSVLRLTEESFRLALDNLESSMRSEMQMTAESLRISFSKDVSSLRSEFTLTAESMRIAFESDVSSLRSEISVQAGRISLVVSGTGNDAEINTASIVLAINESGSEIRLDADKVYIGNTKSTTIIEGKLNAATVTGDWICSKITASNSLNVNTITAAAINVLVGQSTSPVATQTYVSGCIWDLQIVQSGNSYTLQKKALGPNSASWVDVGTFSRAATVSGSWSGGTLTVSANSSGSALPFSTTLQTVTIYNSDPVHRSGKNVYRQFRVNHGIDTSTVQDTGFHPTITINASQVYDYGWDEARKLFSSPTSQPSSIPNHIDIAYPTSDVDGNAGSRSYYLTRNGDYVNLRYGSGASDPIVARISAPAGHTSAHGNCADTLTFHSAPDKGTSQGTQMYYYYNGTLTSAGTKFWYSRDSYQQTTTMYT